MSSLLKIAWRNVLRHRRRTVITALVMSAGIGVFIFFNSTLAGMDGLTIYNMMDFNESAVKIRKMGFSENPSGSPYDYLIDDPEGLARDVREGDSRILAVTRRFKTFATLSNYRDSRPVLLTAVDAASDVSVFRTAEFLEQGSWFGGQPNSVILGSALAADMGVKVGDAVLVSAETSDENINADEYYIVALMNTPDTNLNGGGVFMAFTDAERLLGRTNLATELDCRINKDSSLDRSMATSLDAAKKIQASSSGREAGIEAADIASMAQGYLAMRNMKSKYSSIIILVVLAISGVGIVNTILMSVYSRVKEIGILLAYGMKAREIRNLFITEGAIIGAIGGAGGALIGIAGTAYMVIIGIPMQALIGKVDMGGLPLAGTLYGEWSVPSVVTGIIYGLAVAVLAAWIPARMAARMKPCAALKFI